jgi:DNA-directed RNA polymerase specialized sigma subunit
VAIDLRYYEGLGLTNTATALGITKQGVAHRTMRGIQRIKAMVGTAA